jgi:CBS domain-containing protein
MSPAPVEGTPVVGAAAGTAAAVPADESVGRISSRPVLSAPHTATVWQAWQVLVASGRHHVALVDGDRCVGVLSDRVVLLHLGHELAAAGGTGIGAEPARRLLPESPTVIPAAAGLVEAAEVMAAHGVDALGVFDRTGRLVGVVTATDLLAAACRRLSRTSG